jgi:hypothetical protein
MRQNSPMFYTNIFNETRSDDGPRMPIHPTDFRMIFIYLYLTKHSKLSPSIGLNPGIIRARTARQWRGLAFAGRQTDCWIKEKNDNYRIPYLAIFIKRRDDWERKRKAKSSLLIRLFDIRAVYFNTNTKLPLIE